MFDRPSPEPPSSAEDGLGRPDRGAAPPPGAPAKGPSPRDRGGEWMVAWQRGDERAFAQLVEAYSGSVWSLLTRFLGPREGREDLVQEVFLRVVRARDRYEPTARFTTWLYRIVFNLAVNETERARATTSLELERDGVPSESREPVDVDGDAPDADLVRADLVAAVRAAIAALPEGQRMALVLAKYHDLSYAEIAEVLASSEKAVKSLLHRARENLRASLIPFLEQEVA
jgi:RNA polymerase sigma-70 factor (ECF subfamily)